jgi:hypothetical protein
MQQTAIFVQQMRSCSAPESVHQTQVFRVLSFSGTDRFGPARETNAFKRTKFWQFNRAANEGVTC